MPTFPDLLVGCIGVTAMIFEHEVSAEEVARQSGIASSRAEKFTKAD